MKNKIKNILFRITALLLLVASMPFPIFAANTNSLGFVRASSQSAHVNSPLNIASTGPMSIEFWMEPATTPSGGDDRILTNLSISTNNVDYNMIYSYDSDCAGVVCLVFNRNKRGVANCLAKYTVTLSTVAWTHVVEWYDGTNIKIYTATSGGSHTERASTACSGSGSSGATDTFYIADNNGGTQYYDGLMDEVRVWSKALSTAEMDASFECELTGAEADLQAYYTLNNTLNDSTANAFNLTSTNSPAFSSTVPFATGTCGGGGGGKPKVPNVINFSYFYKHEEIMA